MSAEIPSVRLVPGYCSLCIARCGTVATVTDGIFTRLDPDPTHPTGAASSRNFDLNGEARNLVPGSNVNITFEI